MTYFKRDLTRGANFASGGSGILDSTGNATYDLYTLGARKFAIIGVPPIGCCPAERVVNLKLNGSDGCFEQMNDLARSFYNATETLLNSFTSQFQGVKYSLGNAFDLTMTIINNPLVFGIKDVKTACCGNGTLNGEGQCTPLANLCPNREEYLFWDFVHPTQAVSWLAALTLYGGAQQFVTPMNFSQLAPIDI
ncbi:hypothetical protein TEA_005503 [Camellia sinensis var. sinensis]|uniref:GDSL esterase/lipase n=1 Tax=Camellia sinensis var. sinensis TaxID=542762 RepID=A0A4S4EFG7_CAMSN|nr:hypothetical protein TEA_005503 [Camellia sinensis var. sinensis]